MFVYVCYVILICVFCLGLYLLFNNIYDHMTTSFDGSAKTCFVLDNQHCHVLNYEGSKLTPLSSKGLARQMKRKKDVSAFQLADTDALSHKYLQIHFVIKECANLQFSQPLLHMISF